MLICKPSSCGMGKVRASDQLATTVWPKTRAERTRRRRVAAARHCGRGATHRAVRLSILRSRCQMMRMGFRSSGRGAIEERLISGVNSLGWACPLCRSALSGTSRVEHAAEYGGSAGRDCLAGASKAKRFFFKITCDGERNVWSARSFMCRVDNSMSQLKCLCRFEETRASRAVFPWVALPESLTSIRP